MNLTFFYTHNLVNDLLKIEKFKTALEYLYLPTRAKQKLMYDAKLKKHTFPLVLRGMYYPIIK